MAQFQRHFVQDLTKPLIVRQCGDLGFSGDNNSDIISVDLYTDGEAYSGGGTCAGACICPDGATVALTGSVSGKTASVTLKEDCFAIPGHIGIAIRVTVGTTKTTVLKAIYNVDQFSTDNPVDPGSRVALDVGDLVSDIATALATIPADLTDLMAAVAPTFSTSMPYTVGQYVWYNGKLYRFTSAHSAGSWTGTPPTDAVLASVGTDVNDFKSAEVLDVGYLNDFVRNSLHNYDITVRILNGYFSNSAIAKNDECLMYTFPVTLGESYTVYRGYAMPYGRIAYCTAYPDYGIPVTDYGEFTTSATYKTFTAAKSGYACVLLKAYTDNATKQQVYDKAIIYAGNFDSTKTKTNTSLTIDKINDVDSAVLDTANRSLVADNITEGIMYSAFANGGTTLAASQNTLIYYFPVTSGNVYTVYRGYAMEANRIGYCSIIPYDGCVITGYGELGRAGVTYTEFTASTTGYACVLMRYASDTATIEQILNTSYVYAGNYDDEIGEKTAQLKSISKINGISMATVQKQELYAEHDDIFITSSNLFDGAYVSGKYLNQNGEEGSSDSYAYTKNMIPVYPGNVITANTGTSLRKIRFVTAYDKEKNVLSDKGYSGELYAGYAVPSGVYYIRVTVEADKITAQDFRINNSKTPIPYDTYATEPNNIGDMTRLNRESFSVLPEYYLETMSYRPVGSLSKGYICMVTDDGTSGLASYTIPLAISKNVPFTFGVMKDSEVFADPTMTATVIDAVQNHGCSIAQHGGILWDMMSEKDLVNFFNSEKAFFTSIGLTAEGAVVPQHRTNNLVKAIAGGLYGVVRSGYEGKGPGTGGDVDNYSITNHYDYYTSGARSNIYGLSSYNCAFSTTANNHAAVDYAKANSKIMIVYYHEFDIGVEQKAVIEDLIDYAKAQNLTFIALGDIRYIQ